MYRMPRLLLVLALSACLVSVSAPATAVTWPAGTHRIALQVTRLEGPNRYETAVAVARAGWPGWADVDHVIVASGEDRAFADPLVAGSLCWAYDAPLLLVRYGDVPAAVRAALREIKAANGTVKVTVVGGTASVSTSVTGQMAAILGPGSVEQPWDGGDRYSTAAGVAARVSQVARETSRTVPARAFVANGTDDFGFVDAAALSAVSARTGVPVLLTRTDTLPDATRRRLASLPAGDVIVAGSAAAVSEAVYAASGSTDRWEGPNRYATAAAIAAGARSRGWLTGTVVGIAGSIPDALAGASLLGRLGGPVLHTRSDALPRETAYYLSAQTGVLTQARIFGSTATIAADVAAELGGSPTRPRVMSPTGTYVAKKARYTVSTGINTSEVRLYFGSTLVSSQPARSYATVDFGVRSAPADGVTVRVVAVNPDGRQSAYSKATRRLVYPAADSIVVDKSEFRLYLVKGDVLVKDYPVAIGAVGAETPPAMWKINAKYYTYPLGAYGPRKMRLYRQVGSSYVYTAYNVHGTNQPWTIGTKASAGCVRLYNEDILDLFPRVPLGMLVQTRE
jgi:lipoprotein-anchoring transpeptidase ErfK/SrfK/putative cell wall-binding protein